MRSVLLLVACSCALFLGYVRAAADSAVQNNDPAIVVARVCVKEAGFDSLATGDCAAIRIVLQRVGRGDVVRGARLYTKRTFRPEKLGNRPWIAYLRDDARTPARWPANMDWSRYEARWSTLVARVRAWMRDDYRPCEPHHWGDRYGDHARAVSRGWTEIECPSETGRTRNGFWRNPRLR